MPPITFAHRGARSVEPENTIPAFRRALELGASGLESDAWVTGDGEVVLVHDGRVRRGFRRRSVGNTPADDLRRRGVPRLSELYAELGSDFELSLDLKDPRAGSGAIEAARVGGDPTRLWLCTPRLDLLDELRPGARDVRLVHSCRRDALRSSVERHAADLGEAGIDAMNLHHSDWSAGLVTLFHRFGVLAFAWDAQQVRQLRAALQKGVDAVYCDDVARMVSVLDAWQKEAR
ncbi:MAG: glycerophosphodiester phosphodiesterase [Acidimicrobiia bacterium]